jgi:heptaprenyl diphosphate synthase
MSLPKYFQGISDKALLDSLQHKLDEVEKRIQMATRHTEEVVDVMSSHLAKAGGKRLRPALLLLTAHLGDASKQDVLDAAVVMEVTHLATLYHDDVMDQAETRRGVPAAQKIWGNNLAILTGDLLFARASNIVSNLGERALKMQAQVFEQLVLGQLHESIGSSDQDPMQHYLDVIRDKTGSLIALSAQLGALLSGADDKYQEPLQKYGEIMGIAFQLSDDLIDIRSSAEESGKEAGTDILAGVPTLPVILLANHSDPASVELLGRIQSAKPEEIQQVLQALRAHPVMAEAEEFANQWGDKAISAIDSLPAGSVKSALESFARAMVNRKG